MEKVNGGECAQGTAARQTELITTRLIVSSRRRNFAAGAAPVHASQNPHAPVRVALRDGGGGARAGRGEAAEPTGATDASGGDDKHYVSKAALRDCRAGQIGRVVGDRCHVS